MKVYFAGSEVGGREDQQVYDEFVAHIKKRAGEVFYDHLGREYSMHREQGLSLKLIHDQHLRWVEESSAMVADITRPTADTTYLLRHAIECFKPVLALRTRRHGELAPIIEGSRAGFYTYERSIGEIILAKNAITEFLHNCEYLDLRN